MPDTDLNGNEISNIIQAIKDLAVLQGRKIEDVVLTPSTIKDLANEIAQGTFKALPKYSKILSSDIGKQLQNAVLSRKEENSSLMGKVSKLSWWLGQDTTGSGLQMMRRAEMMGSGVDQIIKGNVLGGLRQFGSAIPAAAKLLSGPFAIGLQTVITGLIQFDKHLTEVNKNVLGHTGGYLSPFIYSSMAEKHQAMVENRKDIRDLNLMSQEKEILGSLTSNFSLGRRLNNRTDLIRGISFNRVALNSMGIDSSTADRMTTGLMRTEGLNANQANAFISRITNNMKEMGEKLKLPEKQVIEETLKGFDANKKFNLSMGWVNSQVVKFNSALEKGTRTMDDFAAVQKSFYGGDTGQLSGLASLIYQNATTSGVELPQELLENINNPYALKMIMSDPEMMKKLGPALQATAKNLTEMSGQAGNPLAEQGFLGDLLSQIFKVNVSRQAVIDLQKNNFDFEKAGLLGTGGSISVSKKPENQKDIEMEAEKFRKSVIDYQNEVTTFLDQLVNAIGELKDGVVGGLKSQMDRNMEDRQKAVEQVTNPKNLKDFLVGQSVLMQDVGY